MTWKCNILYYQRYGILNPVCIVSIYILYNNIEHWTIKDIVLYEHHRLFDWNTFELIDGNDTSTQLLKKIVHCDDDDDDDGDGISGAISLQPETAKFSLIFDLHITFNLSHFNLKIHKKHHNVAKKIEK